MARGMPRSNGRHSHMPKAEEKLRARTLVTAGALALAVSTPLSAEDSAQLTFLPEGAGGTGPVVFHGVEGGYLTFAPHGVAFSVQPEANPDERQFRVNAGYSVGATTGYLIFGGSMPQSEASISVHPVVGLGMRVSLNRALQLSGEIIHHDLSGNDRSDGATGETLSVQAAFRF